MLRKLKTNLTKEDLIKPSINMDDAQAALGDQGSSSHTTGALVLPVKDDVTQTLAQGAATVSTDWMKKGNPDAPAIKEREAEQLYERQQAEAAAAVAARQVKAQAMTEAAAAAPLPIDPTPTPEMSAPLLQPQDPPLPYPEAVAKAAFQPGGLPDIDMAPVKPGMEGYDMPDMWSKPIPPTSPLSPDYQPTATQGPPPQPSPVATPLPAAQQQNISIPAPTEPIPAPETPLEMPNEGVIYIPHDPSKTIKPATTIPAPTGATINISHDNSTESLAFQPTANSKQPAQSTYGLDFNNK